MHPIKIRFKRFEDISFADSLSSIGIYVIWDERASIRPTYLGNGRLNGRIPIHVSKLKLAYPLKWYVGLIYTDGSKAENKEAKKYAEIIEALLMKVASDTNRWPTKNTNEGNMRLVDEMVDDYGIVRVTISGFDPLVSRRLSSSKYIKYGSSN